MRTVGAICLGAVLVTGAAGAEDAADDGLTARDSDRAWHFRVGPVAAPRVRVKLRGPSVSPPTVRNGRTSSSGTSASGRLPADASAGYVERRYADGYVKPDAGTEDPDTITSGLTWDWGADDVPAQYRDGRIEFRTDEAGWSEDVSSTFSQGGTDRDSDRDFLLGVEATGGWTFFDNRTFDAALDAGFRFYGSDTHSIDSTARSTVTTTRRTYRYVDSYDASGWTYVPSGSHAGSSEGPDRLIGALPTRRTEALDSSVSTERHYYRDKTKLDYRIWDLRLGPTVGWRALDDLTIRGGVYGLLGLVDARLRSTSASAGGSARKSSSSCDPIFGMAFGLSGQYDLTDSLFLTGGVEYDWWSDTARMDAGESSARIELSDFSVSVGLGIEF